MLRLTTMDKQRSLLEERDAPFKYPRPKTSGESSRRHVRANQVKNPVIGMPSNNRRFYRLISTVARRGSCNPSLC